LDPADAVSRYFGCEPQQDGVDEPEHYKIFWFQVGALIYEIILDYPQRRFTISGDPSFPFSGRSLYEIYVPYDRIAIETEPCYGDQPILVCRKDLPEAPNFKTLMIVKWTDTHMSVWQNWPALP